MKTTIIKNNVEVQIAYVCSRLQIWSEYIVQARMGEFSGGTTIAWAKLIRNPSRYRSTTLMPVTYDEFREIDELVGQLPQILQDVIVEEWCYVGRQMDKAAELGITRETYRNRLKWAYLELLRMGL